jgi:putative glutamine amidotransferase
MSSAETRALVALSASIDLLPAPVGQVQYTKLATAYTDAIYAAGGRPVLLPVVTAPPGDLLAGFDGLILTGGGDLDPALYGAQPEGNLYGIRPDRDAFEIALYREAVARGLPILAICRGMQLVNILRGGTLTQHITSDPRHWQSRSPGEGNHEIVVLPGSVLAAAVDGSAEVQVNSFHHQCIRDLGHDLRITATCRDVIEAVEATDGDVVAVQWHPEQMAATDRFQRCLFDSFVRRAATASKNRSADARGLSPYPMEW